VIPERIIFVSRGITVCRFHPVRGHEGPYRYSSTLFLNSALEGVRGQRHALAAPYPRVRPGTHCTGGWVGLRPGVDRCGKSCPPPGFDPRTVQPVGSRYTDRVIQPTYPMNTARKTYRPGLHVMSSS